MHVIDEGNLRIFDATSGGLRDVLPLENDKIMSGITVGYNSYVYSDNEGNLYVHNLSSGELKWKKELRDIVISKALITPKNLFVQTSSDVLYAFDLQSGERVWSKKAQAPLLSIRGTSSPIFFEGLIFANFSNGKRIFLTSSASSSAGCATCSTQASPWPSPALITSCGR